MGRLLTVAQFSEEHPEYSESRLRAIISRSRPRDGDNQIGNGFESAIHRVEGHIHIDEQQFLKIVRGKKK